MVLVLKDEMSSLQSIISDINSSSSSTSSSSYLSSSSSSSSARSLSINLGNGNCEYAHPNYDLSPTVDLHKTLIVGYPSGDKRMIFQQMEALTGLPAKDEWDFEYLGITNHPFIKANYPHHEGVWGWDNVADQVVMVVRNVRKSIVEYHDILWDIGYAKTWHEVSLSSDQLYASTPPVGAFFAWRDLRVMDEIQWYGWFIDYWMEGGLLRDIYTHKITTPHHWNMLMMPTVYTRDELDYDVVVGVDTVVTPRYDPHCTNGDVSGGCEPVAVVSAEKLLDATAGPSETAAIADALMNDSRTGQYVIASEAWDCIWEELIQNHKGLKTIYDRPPSAQGVPNFSSEMLTAMITELNRLITKYSGSEWNSKATANRVVSLLTEHKALIQTELNEVNSGRRVLTEKDFLGPKEREARRIQKLKDAKASETTEEDLKQDFTKYFLAIEKKMEENRRAAMKQRALKTARADRLKKRDVKIVNKMLREATTKTS